MDKETWESAFEAIPEQLTQVCLNLSTGIFYHFTLCLKLFEVPKYDNFDKLPCIIIPAVNA